MTFFDRSGSPIELAQWAALHSDVEYTRLAVDVLPNGGILSTIWVGIDRSHGGGGPPLIFETVAFPIERFGVCDRYSTESEALEGHTRLFRELCTH